MTKIFLAIASIFGGLSVAAGAFASHALKDKLSERALEIFETAARYQIYHALALLLVALLINQTELFATKLSNSWMGFYSWYCYFFRQFICSQLN